MTPVLLDLIHVKLARWDDAGIAEMVRGCGGTLATSVKAIRWIGVRVETAEAADVFRRYEDHPDVERDARGTPIVYFSDEHRVAALGAYHVATADAMLPGQTALRRMNVFRAWRETMGDRSVRVAVCDTSLPVDWSSWPEFSTADRDIVPLAADGQVPYGTANHGWGTSQTAVGSAGKVGGPVGVAPKCSLVFVKVGDGSGVTTGGGIEIAAAVVQAVDNGASVVNVSWGTGPQALEPEAALAANSKPLIDAVRYAVAHDVLVVHAAGNSGQHEDEGGRYSYDGCLMHLLGGLSVGSSSFDTPGSPARYSSHGRTQHVVAPGYRNWVSLGPSGSDRTTGPVAIPDGWVSAYRDGERVGDRTARFYYMAHTGTSTATPLVAGVAGLVRSINPALTYSQTRDIIIATVDNADHPQFSAWFTRPGAGIVNAAKAVLMAKSMRADTLGQVVPYVGFVPGDGVDTTCAGGVATTTLMGAVRLECVGYCADPSSPDTAIPITNVKLYAGTDLVYDGLPRTTWDPLPFAAAHLDGGKRLRIVVTAANGATAEEEYTDIVGYATSNVPPRTTATPSGGQVTEPITLTAEGTNPPFATEYRWDGGAWTSYTGPISPRSGTLEYRSTDCIGNREGG